MAMTGLGVANTTTVASKPQKELKDPNFWDRNRPAIIGAIAFLVVIGGIVGFVVAKLYHVL